MSKKHINLYLLINYYNSPSAKRQAELDYCLQSNLNISNVRVHLLIGKNTTLPPGTEKLATVVRTKSRLTYQQFFDYANTLPKHSIVAIVNADISCDRSILLLKDHVDDRTCVCLGRHDRKSDGSWQHTRKNDSQDLWALKTPIPKFEETPGFCLGVPGCDNHIAYILKEKYKLVNPCKTIKVKHIHKSGVRNRKPGERIKGPIRRINPS